MKVSRVIELLQHSYTPDTELMITWWGSECFETKAGVWERAVEIFDSQNTPNDYAQYIFDVIGDAEAEHDLRQEAMVDSYLERVAEERANA